MRERQEDPNFFSARGIAFVLVGAFLVAALAVAAANSATVVALLTTNTISDETASFSGLDPDLGTANLTLLRGCSSDDVLKFQNTGQWACDNDATTEVTGAGADVFDIGDDGINESTDFTELATTNDINGCISEPSADKVLFDLSCNWPTSDNTAALFANPADCAANQFANTIAANGDLTCAAIVDADVPDTITIDLATLATTATALAANGANCAVDNAPLGVDTLGAVETCTDFANISGDTMTGALIFDDNVNAAFGTGSDSTIDYDGIDTFWRLRAAGSGDLMIGQTASPPSPDRGAHFWAGTAGAVSAHSTAQIVVENDNTNVIQFLVPNTEASAIYFGDNNSNVVGRITYDHSVTPNTMTFHTAGTPQVVFSDSNISLIRDGTTTTGALALGAASDSRFYYDGVDTFTDLRATGTGDWMIASGAGFPSPDANRVHMWWGDAGIVTPSGIGLTLENDNDAYISFATRTSDEAGLRWGAGGGSSIEAEITYDHVPEAFNFRIDRGDRLIYGAGTFAFQEETIISALSADLILAPDPGNQLIVDPSSTGTSNQIMVIRGNEKTGAGGDQAYISLTLSDDAGADRDFGRILWEANDEAAASIDGKLVLRVPRNGAMRNIFSAASTNAVFNENQLADLNFSVSGGSRAGVLG